MNKETISVIVAAYNAEKNIERCLDSLVGQTYENLEIIVIDDASKDSTLEICKRYAALHPNIKIIHREKNSGGPCEVWNTGLDAAAGDYIGFCDSDDWAEPDMFECLYNTLNENGTDISVCGWYLETDTGMDVTYRKYSGGTKVFTSKEAIADMFGVWQAIEGYNWNKLSRRKLFENLRFDASVYMYNDMMVSFGLMKDHSVAYVDRQLYHYIIYSSSVTHASYKDWYWSGVEGMEKMYAELPEDDTLSRAKLSDRIIRTCIHLCNEARIANLLTRDVYIKARDIIKNHKKDVEAYAENIFRLEIMTMLMGYIPAKYALKAAHFYLKKAGRRH